MSTTTYPLDNTEYYASDARLFHIGRSAGVFNVTGSDFRVTVTNGSDRTVAVAPGYAYLFTCATDANAKLGGIVFASPDITSFTIDDISGQQRYDYIAIRYDSVSNTCALVYVKGTSSEPTPQRTTTRYELIVAVISVSASVSVLYNADITDTRLNETYCGVVVDTCAKIDTDAMYNQFNSFMTEVKEELDGDVEAKLQAQITANSGNIASNTSGITANANDINSLETRAKALEARQEFKYKIGTAAPTITTCPDGYFYFRVKS